MAAALTKTLLQVLRKEKQFWSVSKGQHSSVTFLPYWVSSVKEKYRWEVYWLAYSTKPFLEERIYVFQTRFRYSFPRWCLRAFTLSPSILGSWPSTGTMDLLAAHRQYGTPWLCCLQASSPIFIHWKGAERNVSTPWTSPDRQHLALWLMAFPSADHTLSRGWSNPQWKSSTANNQTAHSISGVCSWPLEKRLKWQSPHEKVHHK